MKIRKFYPVQVLRKLKTSGTSDAAARAAQAYAENFLKKTVARSGKPSPDAPHTWVRYGKCKEPGCGCEHFSHAAGSIICSTVTKTLGVPTGRCAHEPDQHEVEII